MCIGQGVCIIWRGYYRIYIGREEAGRRNLRGGDMTLREYIYIREEVCILVRVYRREEYVLAKGV